MALTAAELAAQRQTRSWIPQSVARAAMDPKRWAQRERSFRILNSLQ
jgi:hypothetical protein